MRPQTQRAAEWLLAGLAVAAALVVWQGGGFGTGHARGGLTLLVGFTFATGFLRAMLTVRALADGAAPEDQVSDGLATMAATAWCFVLVSPRAGNFLPQPTVDDFTWVYLPVSVLAPFAMQAAQKLLAGTDTRAVRRRFLFTAGCALGFAAGLLLAVSRGEGAGALALRAGVAGALALVASRF